MATKTLIAIALAATLAGCGPTVFDMPPGTTEAQFHRDNLDCAIKARAVVGDSFAFGPPLIVAAMQSRHDDDMRDAHDECMLGNGYTVHKSQ